MIDLLRPASQVFDQLYYATKRKNKRQPPPDRDQIDGRSYSPEAFHEQTRRYFDDPCAFYRDFSHGEPPKLRQATHPRQDAGKLKPAETGMLFDSPISTDYPENDLVPFRWFSDPKRRSKAIILFVPGWGRTSQGVERIMCERFWRGGIDAGLLTKPFHQARAPEGTVSGELFLSANFLWTVASFRQLVAELRVLIQTMRRHYDYIGLFGMSSGGFQACLAANCEPVDFLFPFMSGAPTGSVAWHGMATQYVKRGLVERGLTEQMLNLAWRIIDPGFLGYHCRAVHRRHYVTLYDEIVKTEYQYELWQSLGCADKRELRVAHYSAGLMALNVVDDAVEYMKVRMN